MRTCDLHNFELKLGTAPIFYGLRPPPDEEYVAARAAMFPYAHSFVGGGCVFGDENEQSVYYCPKCREAETEWEAAQAKTDIGAMYKDLFS